ncbi:MAG: hypothetical protein ACPGVB_10155, partial [Chitinophagales bacterium]
MKKLDYLHYNIAQALKTPEVQAFFHLISQDIIRVPRDEPYSRVLYRDQLEEVQNDCDFVEVVPIADNKLSLQIMHDFVEHIAESDDSQTTDYDKKLEAHLQKALQSNDPILHFANVFKVHPNYVDEWRDFENRYYY